MKSEAEIWKRIQALGTVHQEFVGPLTSDQKRITRLMIKQLIWTLGEDDEIQRIDNSKVNRSNN